MATNEFEDVMADGAKTQNEFDMRIAEVNAQKGLAAHGRLTGRFEPVQRNPFLWEMKWTIGDRELRMYHSEPDAEPQTLLALKYHWKRILGTYLQIRDAQDREIDDAALRRKRSKG